MGNIEDFIGTLPNFKDRDEAERAYLEAKSVDEFPRIELTGAFETSRAGIQMVYAIGTGKINWDMAKVDALFYLPILVTDNFFNPLRDDRDVKAIPLDRIYRIQRIQLSKEPAYLKIP